MAGCVSSPDRQQQRYAEAKALFDKTAKEYHLPSAEAKGTEHDRLLSQAAAGYEQLLRQYRDQPHWCAPATRSLANVRAEQGRTDEAVKLYASVESRYPGEEWEILQSWKSAGDLLWEAGQQEPARVYYRKIVERFDTADAPGLYKVIVKGARSKLSD